MAQKSAREEMTELARRVNLVEQTLELTVTWQYGLRNQADELLDALRADALDDTPARLEALEAEVRTLRRMVQDLTQIVVSDIRGFEGMPAPELEAKPRPAGASPPGGTSAVLLPGAAPRAMTLARFDGPVVRGLSVGLTAVADGFADGAEVTFEVGERGETGESIVAPVMGGVARATWWVPSTLARGAEVNLVARIPPFESQSQSVIEPGDDDGTADS